MSENLEFKLKVIQDDLTKVLANSETQVKGLEKALGQTEKQATAAGKALSTGLGVALGLGADRIFTTITGALKGAISEAAKFSRSIAEINSVLPTGTKLTQDQEKALAQLSERYGTTAQAQAQGFFEAVSAGIEDTATAAQILKGANDAALSGLVDINTAAKVITTTFNAYAASGTTVAQVTDSLVAVTQVSGVKFEEIASTLGRVTNVAAQSGVSIGELGGAVSFLNQRALTTEAAVTGLAGIFNEVSKPSKEAANEAKRLGLEFNQAALQSKGLVGFLQDVTDKTKGNVASLRQLFGDQRAANAIIAISSGEFNKFSEAVDKVTNSQGAASKASKTIRESLDFKLDNLSNSFNGLIISIGEKFIPLIDAAAKSAKLFRDIIGDTPKSLDENKNKLNALALEYNNLVDRVSEYNKTQAGSESSAKAALESRLKAIEAERQAIRNLNAEKSAQATTGASTADESPQIASLTETDKQLKIKYAEIFASQEQGLLALENGKFEASNQAIQGEFERNEAEIARIYEFETRKAEIKAQLEEQKAALNLTGDELSVERKKIAQDQELANLEAGAKRRAAIEKNIRETTKKGDEEILRFKQLVKQKEGDILVSSLNLAAALAKDGSKEQFVIQKATALAQIAIARGQALAMIPAQVALLPDITPTQSIRAAAAAKLATYANIQAALGAGVVAATALKGYAGGGIVGASSGPDNKMATVRDGEMILNAEQQKNLFDFINNGSGGGDIVIQLDGREIAKAVRSQVQGGFKLA